MFRLGPASRRLSVSAFPRLSTRFIQTLLLVLALTLARAFAANADSFSTGEFVTHVQTNWADPRCNAGVLNSCLIAVNSFAFLSKPLR